MPEIASKNLNKEKVQCVLSKIMRMNDSAYRQKAFVSLLAISAFSEYLEENGVKPDTDSNLHSIPSLPEEFDVFDIRTKNRVVINVRAVLDDEYTQLCIPRNNFSNGLRADIYVGVRIDRALQKAEFIGYIKADDVPRTKGNKNYFIINSEELEPVSKIDEAIDSIKRPAKSFLTLDHDKAAELFVQYIDGIISEENKTYLIEHLTGCYECRKAFINLSDTDQILKDQKDRLQSDKDTALRLLTDGTILSGPQTMPEDKTKEFLKDEDITAQTLENEKSIEEEILEQEIDEVLEKEKGLEEDMPAQFIDQPAEEETISDEDSIEPSSKETIEEPVKDEEKEAVSEQQKSKKRHHRDWADALAGDLVQDVVPAEPAAQEQPAETKNEPVPEEPVPVSDIQDQTAEEGSVLEEPDPADITTPLEEEPAGINDLTLTNPQDTQEDKILEEALPELTLKDQEEGPALEEITFTDGLKDEEDIILDETAFTSNLKEDPPGKTLPASEQASISQPVAKREYKQLKQEDVDLMLEDILETLDDVEVVNEEDDINSLLSFIDQDASIKFPPPEAPEPAPAPEPFVREEKPSVISAEPDSYDPSEESEQKQGASLKDVEDEKHGDYATVLDSKREVTQENLDILVYEETRSSVEEITQEDLLSIFDPNAGEEEYSDKGKKKIISLQEFFKDKSMVAFTAAITLSTTVLFMYLGQINNQVQVSSVIKQDRLEKWNQIQNQKKKDDFIKTGEKRERKPLKYYTREVVKTVKNEIPDKDKPKKEKIASTEKKTKKEIVQPEIPIKNISWELNATVARNPKIKKYFLDVGYMLKKTLSEKLYDPETEISGVNINIYAELDSRGNILKSFVYEGSGLDKIDEKCLSALQATLVQNRLPDSISGKDKIKLKLLIRI